MQILTVSNHRWWNIHYQIWWSLHAKTRIKVVMSIWRNFIFSNRNIWNGRIWQNFQNNASPALWRSLLRIASTAVIAKFSRFFLWFLVYKTIKTHVLYQWAAYSLSSKFWYQTYLFVLIRKPLKKFRSKLPESRQNLLEIIRWPSQPEVFVQC